MKGKKVSKERRKNEKEILEGNKMEKKVGKKLN